MTGESHCEGGDLLCNCWLWDVCWQWVSTGVSEGFNASTGMAARACQDFQASPVASCSCGAFSVSLPLTLAWLPHAATSCGPSLPLNAINIQVSWEKDHYQHTYWCVELRPVFIHILLSLHAHMFLFDSSLSSMEDAINRQLRQQKTQTMPSCWCQIRNDRHDNFFFQLLCNFSFPSRNDFIFLLSSCFTISHEYGWNSPGGISLSDKINSIVQGPKPPKISSVPFTSTTPTSEISVP